MVCALAEYVQLPAKVGSSADDFTAAMSADPPAFEALIAEENHAPVGMAIYFFTYSTWRGSAGIYLQDIYVAPEARAGGLGQQLMREVCERGRRTGADHLRLSVDPGNTVAQSFYTGIGMKYRDDEMIYDLKDRSFDDFLAHS